MIVEVELEDDAPVRAPWRGSALQVEVEVRYRRGLQASTHGPPERWHPADPGEWEVTSWEIVEPEDFAGLTTQEFTYLDGLVGDLVAGMDEDRIREGVMG